MSLKGKNRAIFSYNNVDRNESNFVYKDFEKTRSYHSSFVGAKFTGISFRAAHMKYCNFSSSVFQDSDFVGTNLRGSIFSGVHFKNCIFVASVLDKTNFKNATFENCYLVATGVKTAKNFPANCDGLIILPSLPPQDSITYELRTSIESLRDNDLIRRSNTLHGKNGKVNTLTIMVLHNDYTDEELIRYLPMLPQYVSSQFYTVSYLKTMLKIIKKSYII